VWQNPNMLAERIARFIAAPDDTAFEELALATFAFQYREIAPYRSLCEALGASPDTVTDWRQIPAVPTLAFKTLRLCAGEPLEVFRSSGTGGERSVHHHPFPELYRQAVDASFPHFCLPHLDAPPMLALVPERGQLPDSSLAFMVDHVLRRWGGDGSGYAFGPRGIDFAAARSWLSARQRGGRPVLLLATSFALAQLLETLERRGLRFRLPAGSVLFDTGGFKGKHREVARSELLEAAGDRLGILPGQVVREYGMTELSSQCYTPNLVGGNPERFVGPPWVRVRCLDPETLEEAAPGEAGLLAVLDLANLGSALHLLTEDLGRCGEEGFHLLGRASESELRGCSLTVEELTRTGGPPPSSP
jgi:hypothetical protein